MTTPQPGDVSLAWLFDLKRLDRDLFVAPSPHYVGRHNLFGGQVAAQALMAAGRTVDAPHRPHSFHLYFMRAGRIGEPVLLYVNRIRDGRSFTTRNVVAQQDGEAILTMSASFHLFEPGQLDYQLPPAAVASPEEAAANPMPSSEPERDRSGYAPTDALEVPGDQRAADGTYTSAARYWMRFQEALPDDPLVHACALAYLSDSHTGTAPLIASGLSWEDFTMTSLDHALYFHRHIRADDWMLVDCEPVAVVNSRGMTRMTIHSRDGILGATVAQELLMRERPEGAPASPPPGTPDRL